MDIDTITENPEFVPYEQRLSHRPDADALEVEPVSTETAREQFVPSEFDGYPLVGLRSSQTAVTATYAAEFQRVGRHDFLSAGGLILVITPVDPGSDVVQGLLSDPDTADQAIRIEVGPFVGALGWADPDAEGLRAHHLIWSDGQHVFNLQAERSPERIVRTARESTCSA